MRKYQIILALTIATFVGLSGCTSKKVENESTDAAELTGDGGGDAETGEGGEEASELSDDFGGDEGGEATAQAEESTEESAESDADAVAEEDSGEAEEGDEATDEEVAEEDGGEAEEGMEALETAQTPEPAPPAADPGSSLGNDEMSGLSSAEPAPVEEAPVAKPVVPLKKMLTTPYTKEGVVVNAIYIARSGDTLEGVSQKIYGQDRVSDLKKLNGHVAYRDLRVGDKIYYNSPQRPDDSSQLLVYYEDIGLTAEIHEVTKDGENIRTVAKELLGDENSWKEVWATNPDVESKDVLEVGTRLRYWSNGVAATAAPVVAAASPAETAPPTEPPPPSEPPPMPDEAAPEMGTAVGTTEPPPPDIAMNEPPPPPPPVEAAPPPPAPAPEAQPQDAAVEDSGVAMADDQMVWFGLGGAVLLAVVAILIIARKRRAKKGIDFQTATHTQIE